MFVGSFVLEKVLYLFFSLYISQISHCFGEDYPVDGQNGNGKGLNGVDHRKKDQRGEEAGDKENTYTKELTVSVELIGEDTVTMMEVMKATKELMACRKIGLK